MEVAAAAAAAAVSAASTDQACCPRCCGLLSCLHLLGKERTVQGFGRYQAGTSPAHRGGQWPEDPCKPQTAQTRVLSSLAACSRCLRPPTWLGAGQH